MNPAPAAAAKNTKNAVELMIRHKIRKSGRKFAGFFLYFEERVVYIARIT